MFTTHRIELFVDNYVGVLDRILILVRRSGWNVKDLHVCEEAANNGTRIQFIMEGKADLRLLQAHGVAARVSVGDKEQILLNLDEEADLTPLLQPGDNEVTVLLLGFNRNLLGPHHHVKGIPALVGPSTFAGTYGFEDFVSPELKRDTTIWVDGYHVIPFGCDGFAVTEYGTAQP